MLNERKLLAIIEEDCKDIFHDYASRKMSKKEIIELLQRNDPLQTPNYTYSQIHSGQESPYYLNFNLGSPVPVLEKGNSHKIEYQDRSRMFNSKIHLTPANKSTKMSSM